jgi:hypothetical protein
MTLGGLLVLWWLAEATIFGEFVKFIATVTTTTTIMKTPVAKLRSPSHFLANDLQALPEKNFLLERV